MPETCEVPPLVDLISSWVVTVVEDLVTNGPTDDWTAEEKWFRDVKALHEEHIDLDALYALARNAIEEAGMLDAIRPVLRRVIARA